MKFIALIAAAALLAACTQSSASTVNEEASLPNTPLLRPREWRVLTSWADRKNGTLSTLYGDNAAVESARGNMAYPPGAHLEVVTWKRDPDARWFGAFVPGAVQSVEEVEFPTASVAPVYRKYEGQSLTKSATDPEETAKRTAYIVNTRPSIVP